VHGVPAHVVNASHEAYVYALQYGLRLGAAVALLGALLAWMLVERRPSVAVHTAQSGVPARPAETVGV
jgi:hypothetical protein